MVKGRQLHVTVLAFSCLTTTQCSMSSAVGGGSWLRGGGGIAATGCFFAAQPARSRQNTRPAFLMSLFSLSTRKLVDGNLGYTLLEEWSCIFLLRIPKSRCSFARSRPGEVYCGPVKIDEATPFVGDGPSPFSSQRTENQTAGACRKALPCPFVPEFS